MAHSDRVAEFFGNPQPYLQRSYNIRIRRETILEMVRGQQFSNVLDIGCGDGSLSLQLLGPTNRIVLLDLSEPMLAKARASVPNGLEGNVTALRGDLMTAPLPPKSFDLILCMGVLAHVDSPKEFIAKMCSLLKPGGSIITTVSCGSHFMGRMRRLYLSLRDTVRPPLYRLRWLSVEQVLEVFRSQGLHPQKGFRYNFPAPGMDRLLSNETLYRNIRRRHGSVADNKHAWLGSEHILWLTDRRQSERS